jgi:hypothetical protein
MKKLLLLIFLLPLFVFSQTNVYHPFPDSAFWRVDAQDYDTGPPQCGGDYYYHYYLRSDTLINNLVYKTVYRSPLTTAGSPCFWWGVSPGYVCALRDDSILNKVFIVPPLSTADTLLFDYNMNVGDTVKGFIAECSNAVVTIKDSVMIAGQYHKRWFFNGCFSLCPQFIIEGIGTCYGLFEPIPGWFQKNSYLVCVEDSSGNLFSNSCYSSPLGCRLITTIYDDLTNFYLSISPNPSSGIFTVASVQEITAIEIYNLLGEEVFHQQILKSSNQQINLSSQSKGIYFIKLQSADKTSIQKIIIH